MAPLNQHLLLDLITMRDKKHNRTAELRRALVGVSLGSDDNAVRAARTKPPAPAAMVELRRIRANVQDCCLQAKARACRLDESIKRLDKFSETLNQKQNGQNSTRVGSSQADIQANTLLGKPPLPRKPRVNGKEKGESELLHDKSRGHKADIRPNTNPRKPLVMGKDKGKGEPSDLAEEKSRMLPAGAEGCENKLKRKRAVGSGLARTMDMEDPKRVANNKFSDKPVLSSFDTQDPRKTMTENGHKVAPGASTKGKPPRTARTGLTVTKEGQMVAPGALTKGKAPGTARTGLTVTKEGQMVAPGALTKGKAPGTAWTKLTATKEDQTVAPGSLPKGKSSRTALTGSLNDRKVANCSRTDGGVAGLERYANVNKVSSVSLLNNRKRSMTVPSSSSSIQRVIKDVASGSQQVRRRPRGTSPDFTDGDHEELLAAASLTRDASYNANCGSFWKTIERHFRRICSEDLDYLKQISMGNVTEEDKESRSSRDQVHSKSLECTSHHVYQENHDGMMDEHEGRNKTAPLYLRLLSALIVEDKFEKADGERDIDAVCASKIDNPSHLDDKILKELQILGLWPEGVPDLVDGAEKSVDELISIEQDKLCQQPDLVDEVEKSIDELICEEQNKLQPHQQDPRKKQLFEKIMDGITKEREAEERAMEQSGMDKLVELADKKLLATNRRYASKNKLPKVSKQAAMNFVKRTVDRCQEFEETGKSCFSEPKFRKIILAEPTVRNDARLTNSNATEAAEKLHSETRNSHPESGSLLDNADAHVFHKGKMKEVQLLPDDVVPKPTPSFVNVPVGSKRKRSDRKRDKVTSGRNVKSKPSQETAPPSTSELENVCLADENEDLMSWLEHDVPLPEDPSAPLDIPPMDIDWLSMPF